MAGWFRLTLYLFALLFLSLSGTLFAAQQQDQSLSVWFLFTEFDGANTSLYRMRLDGKIHQFLAHNAVSPSWSPDGKWIAFTSTQQRQTEIYRMRPDGSQRRRLTSSHHSSQPVWSPDGKSIAYVSRLTPQWGTEEIFVMDADGSHSRQLTSFNARRPAEIKFNWSPDGQWIVLTNTHLDFYLMQADGSNLRLFENIPTSGQTPVWSPNSCWIAYKSGYDIYKIRPDGSEKYNLTENISSTSRDPVWSPDGRQLVFAAAHLVYIMDADGSRARPLAKNMVSGQTPSWSPDGQWIVFSTREANRTRFFRIRPDSSDLHLLSEQAGYSLLSKPVWSPAASNRWTPNLLHFCLVLFLWLATALSTIHPNLRRFFRRMRLTWE